MADTKQLMIQRLVDGELDRQQVRKLLHQAESESVMYRQIALAMIEDQIWDREICQLESRLDVASGSAATAQTASGIGGDFESSDDRRANLADRPQENSWRRNSTFLALTVTTLLMTWLGYSAGLWQSGKSPVGPGMNSGAGRNVVGAPAIGSPQNAADPYAQYSPYRMQMVSNDTGLDGGEEFPVIPISTARELGVKYEPIQANGDLQRRLNRQGYELRPEIQYIRAQMDDGRQIIVPVQRMQLRQWGQ